MSKHNKDLYLLFNSPFIIFASPLSATRAPRRANVQRAFNV